MQTVRGRFRSIALALVIIIVVGVAAILITMTGTVDVGYGTIVVNPITKTVSGPILGPSWYFKAPWESTVKIYYATRSVEMGPSAKYIPITVLSKDGLEMVIDILIRYQLLPSALVALYRSFPNQDWEVSGIVSLAREYVRNVISNYTSIEIIEQREVIVGRLRTTISDGLMGNPLFQGALGSVEVDLRKIDPPQSFKDAINAKLKAEQEKIQAEFERETVIVQANATAMKSILEAEGQAKAKIIVADGIRQGVELITQAVGIQNSTEITMLYLQLEALKEIAPQVNVLILGGSNPLIFQIPTNSTK
ncbi:prohibitin family protein [Candidatus Bathyarchaeota archaeon]|nr:prohibitin family protein [Candidatus Bathyarchaeota archaeon]